MIRKILYTFTVVAFFQSNAQQPDLSFGTNGKVMTSFGPKPSILATIALQTDGKILACGSYFTYTTSPFFVGNEVALSRYNIDGSPDINFGTQGKVIIPIGSDTENENNTVSVLNDGKILILANNTVRISQFERRSEYTLIKYNADGSPDSGFGNNGIASIRYDGHSNWARTMAIQPDNKIVLVGNSEQINGFDYGNFVAVRLNADGSKDSGFGDNGRVDYNVGTVFNNSDPTEDNSQSVAIQADGKILIGGGNNNTTGFGSSGAALMRLNANGTLDTAFGNNGRARISIGSYTSVNRIQLLPDGKIIGSGVNFYNDNNNEKIIVFKCQSNGVLDATFGNEGKVVIDDGNDDPVFFSLASILQSDGKILVSGWGNKDEHFDAFVVRLNIDGSNDSDFGNNGYLWSGLGQDMIANDLLLQNDGKLLIGGTTTNGNTANEFILWRYDDVNLTSRQFDEAKFKVSPNPFQNMINIDFKMTKDEFLSFELIDQTGRKIQQLYSGNFNIGQNSQQLQMPQLPKGIYFLNISGRQISKTIKIIN